MTDNPAFKVLFAIILLLALAGPAETAELESEILQYKLDRLYFPFGIEENLFEQNRFVIYKDDDSIYTGYIEASLAGVSYSFPTDQFFDTIAVESCGAVIETAEIDSLSAITIGLSVSEFGDYIPYVELPNLFYVDTTSTEMPGASPPDTFSVCGNALKIRRFPSYMEMMFAFESGEIDCFISYSEYASGNKGAGTIIAPAPYFAAMIPDVSRSVNHRGLLTTSLYYRYNPDLSSVFFEGSEVTGFNGLYLNGEIGGRPYRYDPRKGRKLLEALRERPKKVSVDAGSGLAKLGDYFADILARDRIRAHKTGDDADICLAFVPLSSEELSVSLEYIYNLLTRDTVAGEQVNTTIKIIGNYIELGKNSIKVLGNKYYYNLAERSLIEDIGVFPLFRPALYFTTRRNIRGGEFNENGFIDLTRLCRLKLPGEKGRDI